MRRSELLKVAAYCPHFKRTVAVTKNAAIDRLVDCDEKDTCFAPADPDPSGGPVGGLVPPRSVPPRSCPVFPSLAK